MKYISSDTNIWIDFQTIHRLDIPFLLPYTYIMHEDMIEKELLSSGLKNTLIDFGLQKTTFIGEEKSIASQFKTTYPRLSVYDTIALAIAKNRKLALLTGDRLLRNAAENNNVPVFGTIGILDCIAKYNLLTAVEICSIAKLLYTTTQQLPDIRLPLKELQKRIAMFCA